MRVQAAPELFAPAVSPETIKASSDNSFGATVSLRFQQNFGNSAHGPAAESVETTEQARRRIGTPEADIFAAAVLAYELLTLRFPWQSGQCALSFSPSLSLSLFTYISFTHASSVAVARWDSMF